MRINPVIFISLMLVGALAACQTSTAVPAPATLPPTPVVPTETISPTRTPIPDTDTPIPAPTLTNPPPATPLPVEFVWKIDGAPHPFNAPVGLALDAQGDFYVMDTKNAQVKKYDPQGNFLLMWGSAGAGQFLILVPDVGGLELDSHGNVYVLDVSNYRLQKFDRQGKFLTQWGSKGDGPGQFLESADIAIDSQNHVYVGDYLSNYVQKFDENGKLLLRWGSGGQFSGIYSLALDPDGNVLVGDERNILRKFDSNGNFLSEIPLEKLDNHRISLWNLAVDGQGNIYVSDHESYRIVVLDPQGRILATWRGSQTGGSRFDSLQAIAIDGQGNVYISDANANLVQKFRLLVWPPGG
jgi:tripartite motif-containing protein 71